MYLSCRNYHCPPKILPLTTDCDSITCAHEACYMAGKEVSNRRLNKELLKTKILMLCTGL